MGSHQTREVREFEKVDSPVAEGLQKLINFVVLFMLLAPIGFYLFLPFEMKQIGILIIYESVAVLVLYLLMFGLGEAAKIPQRVQKIRLEGSEETVIDSMAALKLSATGFLPTVPKSAALK
mmetsp:Transcript_30647/g.49320  ORF Transcript_30647/g.49320 Transcript_30647/m.49320 type:complete len:121 (+) Transcript_30647:59-421(+)